MPTSLPTIPAAWVFRFCNGCHQVFEVDVRQRETVRFCQQCGQPLERWSQA